MRMFGPKKNSYLDQVISELREEQLDPATLSTSAKRVWRRIESGAGEAALADSVELIRSCADIRALLPAFHKGELAPARALIVEDHLRQCVSCRAHAYGIRDAAEAAVKWQVEPATRGLGWSFAHLAYAALVMVMAVTATWMVYDRYFSLLPGSRARIESIEGQAFRIAATGEQALKSGDQVGEGEFIRTAGGSRARVKLLDASTVEMNERAEFSVSANRRDTTIHLEQGNILVQAGKRHAGHLYVKAPDCLVAVTGTVFSVNSGTKGSRVAVIEGEVHVEHNGSESVLHPGDEVATTPSVGLVPVQEEIAWSSNLDRDLALLAEFSQLRTKLEQIQIPGPRYDSRILPLLPTDTVLYVSIPNFGDALAQANQVFQQQLSQSKALQQWWNGSRAPNNHPTAEVLIQKVHAMSQYLGDEVVLVASPGTNSGAGGPVLLAEVRMTGLRDFLQNQMADTAGEKQGAPSVRVVDEQSLSSPSAGASGLIALVKPNMLVVGGDVASVRRISAQLDSGASGLAGSDFGQEISSVYRRGTEVLIAANLERIVEASQGRNFSHDESGKPDLFATTGLKDVKYLIATRSEASGQTDNRAVLEFNGERRGMASWLAAPAPMGSLEYVSSDAGAVFSVVAKQPVLMLDDLFSTIDASDANFNQDLARAESDLGLDIRRDLASTLGGDVTLALDGPVLPTPSWKLVVEVNDSARLERSIETLVQRSTREEAKPGQPNVTLDPQQVNGRTFYTIRTQGPGIATEFDYTFADGYMILAPSRPLVIAALSTHAGGTSLARSASFRALLPADSYANFSAMVYQNLGPVLQPLASNLTSQQMALVRQLTSDAKPSVICAYGESDRIQIVSTSKFFGLDPDLMTLTALLGSGRLGTSSRHTP